jgi:hypothetical protein
VIYQWKDGAHIRGRLDAQQVGERLEVVRKSTGALTASHVVDDARPPEALLHPIFEWDDSVAAEEFRRSQARLVLRSVVAIPDSAPESPPIRAFVVVSEVGEPSYVPTYYAMSDEQLRAQVVSRALAELRQFQARYR